MIHQAKAPQNRQEMPDVENGETAPPVELVDLTPARPEGDGPSRPRRNILASRVSRLWLVGAVTLALVVGIAVVNSPDEVTGGRAVAGADLDTSSPTTQATPSTVETGSTEPGTESNTDPTGNPDGILDLLNPGNVTAGPTDNCGNPIAYADYTARPADPGGPGSRVLIGAAAVADLGTGQVVTPLIGLAKDEMVIQTVPSGTDIYLVVTSCTYEPSRTKVIRVDKAGHSTPVRVPLGSDEELQSVLAVGPDLFALIVTEGWTDMQPLEGGPLLGLPKEFSVYGSGGGYVFGTVNGASAGNEFVAYNPKDDSITDLGRLTIGASYVVAFGTDRVVWSQADPGTDQFVEPGTLASFVYATGRSTVYPWHAPAGIYSDQVSPDGRYLAGRVQVMAVGTDLYTDVSSQPPETGVLDLKTGKWTMVAGLSDTSVYGGGIGMAFSQDSKTLILSVNTPQGIRLLTWDIAGKSLTESGALVVDAGAYPYNPTVLPAS
ncbi:hypothetical protein D1871_08220 [Nakamurella silvestris]|nr:hypothetical protein D1871_08220 [Nakamurella silvestris]